MRLSFSPPRTLLLFTLTLWLGACSTVEKPLEKVAATITPYRAEVIQGNFVSKEQAQVLRVGMSRNQVRDILGTPLVSSLFHGDRWDYAFTIRRQGTAPQQRKFSVFFKDNQLERFEGDELPTEAEFAAGIDNRIGKDHKVPKLEATAQQLEAFKPSKTEDSRDKPIEPAAATLNYPPLETPDR